MSEGEQPLCPACREVDIDGQLEERSNDPGIRLGKFCTIINTTDCVLCWIVTEAMSPILTESLLKYAEGKEDTLFVYLTPSDTFSALNISLRFFNSNETSSGIENSICWDAQPFRPSLHVDMNYLHKSRLFSSEKQRPCFSARMLPQETCDFDLIRRHLDNCIEHHKSTCGRNCTILIEAEDSSLVSDQWPLNLRVIDVEEMRVTDAPLGCSYIALSYVWDKSPPSKPFEEICVSGGLKESELPQTIVDAINVCRQLSEKYLWVDALCTIQNDEDDRSLQISQMDKVYIFATATIVAACGDDPSQGLSCLRSRDPPQVDCYVRGIHYIASGPPLRRPLEKSRWNTRGWTYQELKLSRRLIIFTSIQLYFACAEDTIAEDTVQCISGYRQTSKSDMPVWSILKDPLIASCWDLYNIAIAEFTKRSLTLGSDRLPAISGPSASSRRFDKWPSWSWVGWTDQAWNPASKAVGAQWGRAQKTFVTTLKNLRYRGTDGKRIAIDQAPSDDQIMSWLDYGLFGLCRDKHKAVNQAASPTCEDEIFGHLLFTAQSRPLSIVPESNPPEDSKLRRYRILDDNNWIGTVFLTRECAASYPSTTHDCKFIRLTKCSIKAGELASNLLEGLGDWSTSLSDDMLNPKAGERAIFDPLYYQPAKSRRISRVGKSRRRRRSYKSKPPTIHLSHVMLLESNGDSVYRKAVGLIVQNGPGWPESDFCLG
ncbi:heterokaryon incompatibility protein-domain-containing protein [Hypoxylon trugodes]|uniref:heterokaryon incompatibility protein-domain-containing protein n=1 Tax=Hypoxylon trugodes TaxID=326681 RepID=UPI00219391F3|nr:heterokaryon incompatibility protein-domain-containing protein [Hypoxylon trugodes]KAI1392889.1 heterokaryon incompatibility protein-domain-containing protein [Hypoxylon trugodes]